MGYATETDKIKKPEDGGNSGNRVTEPPPPPQSQGSGQAGSILSPEQNAVASPANAGGAGGWTNIQSYLNANKGNTGTADYLKKEVGGTFDNEKSSLNKSAIKAGNDAWGAVSKGALSQDQASKIVADAGKNYNYSGTQNQAYTDDIKKINDARTRTYSGPNDFSYQLGDTTQNYANGLNAGDAGFKTLMGTMYNKAAGGRMGTGALALQSQLDQENPAISSARKALADQYKGLNSYAFGADGKSGKVGEVNTSIGQAKGALESDKSAFKSYLDTLAGQRTKALDDAITQFGTDEKALSGKLTTNPGALRGNQTIADPHSDRVIHLAPRTLNADNYYNYSPSAAATRENIGGVDTSRNEYNAIMDALGLGEKKINDAKDVSHGQWGFDQKRWDRDVKNLFGG